MAFLVTVPVMFCVVIVSGLFKRAMCHCRPYFSLSLMIGTAVLGETTGDDSILSDWEEVIDKDPRTPAILVTADSACGLGTSP